MPLYGLMEGTCYYESQEGILPSGWSFGADSKFDFSEIGPQEEYVEKAKLDDGEWFMQKFWIDENGEKHSNRNCKMVWSNTPFDAMAYLKAGGVYSSDDNIGHIVMSSPDGSWDQGFSGIFCAISPLDKSDYSRRRISISITEKNEANNTFVVTFSM